MSIDSGAETRAQPRAVKTSETAKEGAVDVASSAADGAKEVAAEASTQVKAVAVQAREQAVHLLDQTRDEVVATATEKSHQAAAGLRNFAEQLRSLAEGRPDQAGQLERYVQEAQDKVATFADRLEREGPQALLQDATRFARQRPGLFLVLAAGAGFAIGRLVRAGAAASHDANGSAQNTVTRESSNGGRPLPVTAVTASATPSNQIPTWADDGIRTGRVGEEQ